MIEHGTVAGYRIHGCRCEHCTEANREDARDRAERWETSTVHGTADLYNRGCRCSRCFAAHREWCAERLTTIPDEWHGRAYPYKVLGCRCDRCKAGDHDRYRAAVEQGIPEDDPRHGTEAGYAAGCRCPECKGGIAAAYSKRTAHR